MQLTIEQMEQLTTKEKVLDGVEGQTKKESEIAVIAFACVYSGCVEPGHDLWVIGPKYDPAVTADSLERGQVPSNDHYQGHSEQPLHYILLGRDLEQVDKVPVGNVLGMAGLSTSVLKSATLSTSTTPWCPPFVPLVLSSVPILRVAVEPVLSSDLPRLEDGLQLLNQADAYVEMLVSEAGEHLLVIVGEG